MTSPDVEDLISDIGVIQVRSFGGAIVNISSLVNEVWWSWCVMVKFNVYFTFSMFNSLDSENRGCNLNLVIFKHIWNVGILSIFCENLPAGESDWFSDWWLRYLYQNQCWPDSLTHICVTKGRWVKSVDAQLLTGIETPADAIWWHKSGSTLAQVMACCMMATRSYLKHCWHIISEVHWQLPSWYKFTKDTSAMNDQTKFEKCSPKISFKSPRGPSQ